MLSGAYTGMNESTPDVGVVCDAGPLIHLDELDSLTLLGDFDPVLVPEQVWVEVERHRANVFTHTGLSLKKVPVVISTQTAFQTLVQTFSLGWGEQAALTLMQENPTAIFLTDDAAARLAAVTWGYQVHGTIGILLRALRRQQRSRDHIITTLQNLPAQSTLHIRPGLLQEIITRVKSEV